MFSSISRSTIPTNLTKTSEDLTVSEEKQYENKINSNFFNEFLKNDYIDQIGLCVFKNLCVFLKKMNTCSIVDNSTFSYRTSMIDLMVKNNVITKHFIDTLVRYFQQED